MRHFACLGLLVLLVLSPVGSCLQTTSTHKDTLTQQQFINGCAKYRERVIHDLEHVLTSFVHLSNGLASISPDPQAHIRFRDLIVKAALPENHEMSLNPMLKVVQDLFRQDSNAARVYQDWMEEHRFVLMEIGFLVGMGLLEEKPPYRLSSLRDLWEEFSFYHLQVGMVVADIGAGNGFLSFILLDSGLPVEVILTEVDSDFLMLLEGKLVTILQEDPDIPIRLFKGNNKSLGLGNQKADCIIMREVFHHLKDPMSILEDCKLHLKDEGFLVLSEATKDLGSKKSGRCKQATTYDKILGTMQKAGFSLVAETIVEESYLLKFKPKDLE